MAGLVLLTWSENTGTIVDDGSPEKEKIVPVLFIFIKLPTAERIGPMSRIDNGIGINKTLSIPISSGAGPFQTHNVQVSDPSYQ